MGAGQARPGLQHQLVHERAGRAGRHARHRRRHLRARACASTLRAEMDVLVLVSNCPQINNPCNGFDPTPVPHDRHRGRVHDRDDLRHAPGRQPRRDRRAASSAPPATRPARRSPCSPTPTAAPATSGSPTRRCGSAPRPRQGVATSRRPRPRGGRRPPAPAPSTPATASSPRTPPSPRRARPPGSSSSGPTPEQLRAVRRQAHRPRRRRRPPGVPLIAGTGLLRRRRRRRRRPPRTIGYPVMLKATGGGGGIGMPACRDRGRARRRRCERVQRARRRQLRAPPACSSSGSSSAPATSRCRSSATATAGSSPSATATARCSAATRRWWRRRPRPDLPDARPRANCTQLAAALCAVGRLPLGRHGRVRLRRRPRGGVLPGGQHPAPGRAPGHRGGLRRRPGRLDAAAGPGRRRRCSTGSRTHAVAGHAVEARVYAEDPARDHRPSAGPVTGVDVPRPGVRVDTWVETGTEVTTALRPAARQGRSRTAPTATEALRRARRRAGRAPASTASRRTSGCCGPALARRRRPRRPRTPPATLADAAPTRRRASRSSRGRARSPPCRTGRAAPGCWQVGVPPCGPMDDLSFRLGNRALGNAEGAPGLECTLARARRCASPHATDGLRDRRARRRSPSTAQPVAARGSRSTVPAGGVARRRRRRRARPARPTSCSRGGLDVPALPRQRVHLHPRRLRRPRRPGAAPRRRPARAAPATRRRPPAGPVPPRPTGPCFDRRLARSACVEGPHAGAGVLHRATTSTTSTPPTGRCTSTRPAPASGWSARSRAGPAPTAARPGLHPSNIHDTAVLGRRRRLHRRHADPARPGRPQPRRLRLPGDRRQRRALEARPAPPRRHGPLRAGRRRRVAGAARAPRRAGVAPAGGDGDGGVLGRARRRRPADGAYRRSGDDNLLVEYGPMHARPRRCGCACTRCTERLDAERPRRGAST